MIWSIKWIKDVVLDTTLSCSITSSYNWHVAKNSPWSSPGIFQFPIFFLAWRIKTPSYNSHKMIGAGLTDSNNTSACIKYTTFIIFEFLNSSIDGNTNRLPKDSCSHQTLILRSNFDAAKNFPLSHWCMISACSIFVIEWIFRISCDTMFLDIIKRWNNVPICTPFVTLSWRTVYDLLNWRWVKFTNRDKSSRFDGFGGYNCICCFIARTYFLYISNSTLDKRWITFCDPIEILRHLFNNWLTTCTCIIATYLLRYLCK